MASVADVPPYNAFLPAIVDELRSAGGLLPNSEMARRVPAAMGIPNQIAAVPHGDGRSEIEYRLAWGRTYLKGVGAIENAGRGVWKLTAYGASLTREQIEEIPRRIHRDSRLRIAAKESSAAAYEVALNLIESAVRSRVAPDLRVGVGGIGRR